MPAFTSPAVMARLTSPLVLRAQCTRTLQNPRFAQDALSLPFARSRNSSMSAIVRGVRRSFRDPDGRRPPGRNPAVAAHVSERRRAREAAGPNTFKILRGKKDVTEPPIPKAKSRRARFFDPEEDYGKKSFVYQAKSGALEAEVKALRQEFKSEDTDRAPRESRGDGWGNPERRRESGGRGDRGDRGGAWEKRDSGFTSRFTSRGDGYERTPDSRPRRYNNDRRDDYSSREDRPRERTQFAQSQRSDWTPRNASGPRHAPSMARGNSYGGRDRREAFDGRSGRQDDREDRPARRGWDGRDNDGASYQNEAEAPLSMPYTTAASHFLYGRSVVEAALRSSRRKLYKLYIYGGSSKNSDARPRTRSPFPAADQPNEVLERLAKRQNVEIKVVDERWQRLLDKMSKGRPHNGIVLEASPLPQPPLVALGRYKEEAGRTPGFDIQLDYQSREDAAINGEAKFVTVRTPALPLAEQPEEGAAVAEEQGKTAAEEEEEEEASKGPADEAAAAAEAPGDDVGTASAEEPSGEISNGNAITPDGNAITPDGNAITPAVVRNAAPLRFYRPLVLLLEQVLDPGNLGAILRSASFLGVSAVAVSRHGSATLSAVALKASAGASEDLPLFTVDKPAEFLAQSRKSGWRVYSTVPKPTFTREDQRKSYDLDGLEKADPLRKQPCILVIGSEGEGLSRAIRRKADAEVTIPNQSGTNTVDSLNVSVATGLVCASFLRGATRASNEAARENANGIDDGELDGEDYEARTGAKDELDIW